MKKGIIAIVGGVLLPMLSFIAFVLNMLHEVNNAPTIGIIGGADAPTVQFIVERLLPKHFYSLSLTAIIGLVLIVLGVIWIVKAKKAKKSVQ